MQECTRLFLVFEYLVWEAIWSERDFLLLCSFRSFLRIDLSLGRRCLKVALWLSTLHIWLELWQQQRGMWCVCMIDRQRRSMDGLDWGQLVDIVMYYCDILFRWTNRTTQGSKRSLNSLHSYSRVCRCILVRTEAFLHVYIPESQGCSAGVAIPIRLPHSWLSSCLQGVSVVGLAALVRIKHNMDY